MRPALPPGPRSSLWVLLQYLRDPIHCMVPLAERYGETLTFPGPTPVVMTGDPAGIKAIYTAPPELFEPLGRDLGVFIGERSLLLLSGAEHRRARKLMTPPFHGPRMRAYGAAICRLAAQQADGLRPGQPFAAAALCQRLSLDVILQAVFGVDDPAGMTELARLLLEITDGISPLLAVFPALRREFGGVGPYAAFLRRRRALHDRLDLLIAAGRAAGPRDDILSLLLAARDDDGQPMPDGDIRDQLVLLVFAGHETTAISIAWALYALHRPENAGALARLRGELADLGPDPDPDALARLPYLEAVCFETLRRFPLAPAPNPRRLLGPLEVCGYTLPAGAAVTAAIGVAHFRAQTYPEPLRFSPERFLDRQFSPFEFIPFGGGARRCLGAALATYEMKLVLGTLLGRLRLRLASLRPDRGRVRAANAGPASGIRMIVEGPVSPRS